MSLILCAGPGAYTTGDSGPDGPAWTMGVRHDSPGRTDTTATPAPGHYEAPASPTGPAYTMRGRPKASKPEVGAGLLGVMTVVRQVEAACQSELVGRVCCHLHFSFRVLAPQAHSPTHGAHVPNNKGRSGESVLVPHAWLMVTDSKI